MDHQTYQNYLQILREELIPAMGCTEPIAVALAAAKAREVLGVFPEKIIASCSGNIIKNVKGVIVPGTGNMRGVDTSAILGALAGDASLQLEVLSSIQAEDVEKTRELLLQGMCQVKLIEGVACLHIIIEMFHQNNSSLVEVFGTHTNIVRIEQNGKVLFKMDETQDTSAEITGRDFMNLDDIYEFANTVAIEDVSPILDRQIEYNTRIAEEGLCGDYGANVGSMLLRRDKNDIYVTAKAYAAAGSDARMSGSVLPVVINSGSGNQGMTVSLPVIKFAEHLGSSKEKLYRALVMSNLTAIYQKTGIGRLSAYCGAVSAACGSGVGIAYLMDAGLDVIAQTMVNTLGNVSGIVCDGAKSSCAAKIASSVDAALMGLDMALAGEGFSSGEGIIKPSISETVDSVGRLASLGMKQTDVEILKIMIENSAS